MVLAGIRLAPVLVRMGRIIELNGRDNARIGVEDQEIERQLADAVADRVGPVAAFEIEDL